MFLQESRASEEAMTGNELFSQGEQRVLSMTVCRAKQNVSTELDGETVILDIASGIYSGLDSVGTFIWKIMEHPQPVESLRDAILEQYDVSEEQCTVDLLHFLKDLNDNGLIVITDEATG